MSEERDGSVGKSDMASASDPAAISEYHAHIYYDPPTTRDRAERLRARVAAEFPAPSSGAGTMSWSGRIRSRCFRSRFRATLLDAFLPWLMLNRDGLSVLLHPETGDDYRDHSAHAAWLGAALPLRLDVFSVQRSRD